MRLTIILLLTTTILSACVKKTKTIAVDTIPLARPNLVIPNIDKFSARKVTWIIITKDNASQVFADIEKQGGNATLFAVTSKGYENVALNTKESLRVIIQQGAVINGYKKYYITANNTIYEYNNSIAK